MRNLNNFGESSQFEEASGIDKEDGRSEKHI